MASLRSFAFGSPSVSFARIGLIARFALLALLPLNCLCAVMPGEQLARVIAARDPGTVPASSTPSIDFTPKWGTGGCNSLLPGGFGGVPGSVDTTWGSLQQQAISQVEAFYGQTGASDITNSYALIKARGVTRALMFATLVKAINDVHAGTATADETAWVTGFSAVVQYGRKWMTIDAINRWNAYTNSTSFQSTVANNIVQLFFGLIGLPWRNEPFIPSAEDLLNQAESALWGPPAATPDGAAGDIQNYSLGTAESATALQQMIEALAFLNAIGHTQIVSPGSGTDSALTVAMANVENALGTVSAGDMAEGIMGIKELTGILASGEGGTEHAAVFTALANSIWTLSGAITTSENLNEAENQAFNNSPDLFSALGDARQFSELVNDFVAITLHSLPNALATGFDPDCRTTNKPNNASPPGPDATFTVSHFNSGAPLLADYSYTTPVLGGNAPGTIGGTPPANTVNDPSVLDWAYSRDVGPGAPRIGANWPISEISYGVPGDATGWGLRAPSIYYVFGGYWYITFNGANGSPHTTAALRVHVDSSGAHPTDSEVATAIVNADPQDFPTVPCNLSSARNDPALRPDDKPNWPCLDWNPDPSSHLGTMLIVSGDQWDNNKAAIGDYQVIFDILVKGDLGGWAPQFVGHGGQGPGQPSTCTFALDGTPIGGVCVGFLGAAPFAGDVVESKQLWTWQQNNLCVNDPVTCTTLPSYGWATPYPVVRECQSVSPAAGMFVINYVGLVDPNNPTGSCNAAPASGSWAVTPSIHYRAANGSLWVAWRVPPTIGTSNFLNIQMAQLFGGEHAGVLLDCGSDNGICLEGSGTHWTSEFSKGDGILLIDPAKGQNNLIGNYLSIIRKVDTVLDDTHMHLSSSVECLSASDGNDCEMFSTVGYTSFMNPADGSNGQGDGMLTPCADCVPSPTNFRFDVYKMHEQNPGTTCPVWNPATQATPPAGGCYYSNSIQFQSQTWANDGQSLWWNVSLPPPPSSPAARPIAEAPSSVEPWLDQPIITQQPQSVVVNAGASPSFTAIATGTPTPTVQWQRSTDLGGTWNDISGATNTSYSLTAVTSGQNGWAFRAVFANTNGSRTTQPATLGIYAAPQVTLSPTSVPAAQLGGPITLTSAATGAPQPAANWQFSSDGGSSWNDLGGGTSTLSLTWGPSPAPSLLVRVVYSNQAGSATSQPAVVAGDDIFHNGYEPPPAP